jgi:hypothetical protein
MRYFHPATWPDRIVTTVIAKMIFGLMLWMTRAIWNRRAPSGNVFVKGGTAVATASGSGGAVVIHG